MSEIKITVTRYFTSPELNFEKSASGQTTAEALTPETALDVIKTLAKQAFVDNDDFLGSTAREMTEEEIEEYLTDDEDD